MLSVSRMKKSNYEASNTAKQNLPDVQMEDGTARLSNSVYKHPAKHKQESGFK